jgi:predicted nucleic acid-binding protein
LFRLRNTRALPNPKRVREALPGSLRLRHSAVPGLIWSDQEISVNGFLLDTNVISELIKAKPNGNVVRWIEETDESILFLSVLALGEIRKGIERLSLGRRRGRLESWLDVDLRARFQNRVLPIDSAIAERWGTLSAIAEGKGRPVPVIDGLLAATALHHDLMLVTRNDSDLAGTGVPTLNPWL